MFKRAKFPEALVGDGFIMALYTRLLNTDKEEVTTVLLTNNVNNTGEPFPYTTRHIKPQYHQCPTLYYCV